MNRRGSVEGSLRKTFGRVQNLLILLVLVGFSFHPIAANAQNLQDGPDPTSIDAPPPDSGAHGSLPNLSSSLSSVYTGWQSGMFTASSLPDSPGLEFSGERVKVMLVMIDQSSALQAIKSLTDLESEVIYSYETWIDAWVPVTALAQAAALPGVSLVRDIPQMLPVDPDLLRSPPALDVTAPLPQDAAPAMAPATTQGVAKSGANLWHTAGWTGAGMKVAVLDTFKNYLNAVTAGELPANITIYSPSWSPIFYSSPHGTACAEIIYDMAPGARLTFATPSSPTTMAGLILELAKQGNKIISVSYGWQGLEPGDGTGPLNNAIRTAYLQYGTLVVQSAGNEAEHHWDGVYSDTNADFWHEFSPGNPYIWLNWNPATQEVEQLTPNWYDGVTDISINLRWSSWPVTANDYDLYLVRWNGTGQPTTVIASSQIRQVGNQPPTESILFEITQAGYYGIAVQRISAVGNQTLDVYGHWLPPFSVNVPARSLIDAAASPYALTIAAVDATSLNLESYSSQGPTKGSGGVLSGGLFKPNISGFANVDTWSYGAGGFSGTSSAAPHVAGAAALVWQAYPGSHPYHIWNHLVAFSQDRGTTGADYLYGAGVLKMMTNPPANPQIGQNPPGQCQNCAPVQEFQTFLPLLDR